MKELLLAAFSVISSILIVILLVGFGWYIVWKVFLSRFRFVRELIGGLSENSNTTEKKQLHTRPRKARLE